MARRRSGFRGNHRGKERTPRRKVRLFTAVVFVIASASVASLLFHLEQSAFAAITVGLLVGATAAVEVGFFGGTAFFGEDGEE